MKPKAKKVVAEPTISKKGLIRVQFPNGKTHEYMPILAKKLVDNGAAQYI